MKLTEITVSRLIAAPAEAVFDVWIDPKGAGGPWFGAERVIMRPEPGGLFYYAVRHEGRTWPHYGRFLRVDRPAEVAYTWVSEATQGIETVVTVSFAARGTATEVTLRHSGVPDDKMGRRHQDGWTWGLSNLAKHFVAGH